MEALDSVHIDDIGSQAALNKVGMDPITPVKGAAGDNFGQQSHTVDSGRMSNNIAEKRKSRLGS